MMDAHGKQTHAWFRSMLHTGTAISGAHHWLSRSFAMTKGYMLYTGPRAA